MGFRSWVREHFITPDTVYGTILFAALVAGVSDVGETALHVLVFSLGTLVVFWAAHIYSGTIARHGVTEGTETTLGAAFRSTFVHCLGMLYAAVLPSVALLLGVVGVLSESASVTLALWTAVVVLAWLGYLSFARRGSPLWVRLLGALGTAAFGAVLIALKYLVQ
jgi:hypothetical protein